jgi:predicted RND superfamily exporter protein
MLGRPRTTLAAVALLSVTLLPAALRVPVDSAVDRLLPSGDEASIRLERLRAVFGSDEIVLVALFADDVFTAPALARLAALTEAISRLAGVRDAASLTTLERLRDGPDGLGRARILPPPPWTPDVLARVRRDVAAHPLARAGVVAPDDRAAGIIVRLAPMTDEALLRSDLVGRVQAAVAAHPGPEAVAVTGLPVLKVRAAEAMVRDVRRFFVLGVLMVAAVLLAAFRSLRGLLLPLGAVLAGVAWTSAAMTLSGDAYTLGTLVLSPLLLSVGIAYAIHVLTRYQLECAQGGSRDAVVRRTLAQVLVPLVMAAVTTLAGFAAFLRNPIPTIQDFGWYAGIGLACVLVATLAILPSALVLLPLDAGRPPRTNRGWIDRLTAACTRLALRRGRSILAVSLAALVVAGVGIGRIRVETDYLRFFAPTHPARLDNARVAERLVGTQVVVVALDGGGPETMTRVAAVQALRGLVDFLRSQPGVDHVGSYLDHLAMLRQVIEPDQADEPLRDQAALDQRIVLLNTETMRGVLNADRSQALVVLHTRLSGSGEVRALVEQVRDYGARRLPAWIAVHTSGTLVLLTDSADTLARQQVAGLAQVLVVLALLLVILFRSLRLGVLSLVPNLFPVVLLFGIMGWAGIDLNVSTSMIACIAIGIAVDDTIHYLTAYEAARRARQDVPAAVATAVRTVGRPIVVTSVALAAGFLVPCLSSFQPVRHFGMLASVTMALALFADLLLLPTLLVRFAAGAQHGRP